VLRARQRQQLSGRGRCCTAWEGRRERGRRTSPRDAAGLRRSRSPQVLPSSGRVSPSDLAPFCKAKRTAPPGPGKHALLLARRHPGPGMPHVPGSTRRRDPGCPQYNVPAAGGRSPGAQPRSSPSLQASPPPDPLLLLCSPTRCHSSCHQRAAPARASSAHPGHTPPPK